MYLSDLLKLIYSLKFCWYADHKHWDFDHMKVGDEKDVGYVIRVGGKHKEGARDTSISGKERGFVGGRKSITSLEFF